jgi:hypothetical protein
MDEFTDAEQAMLIEHYNERDEVRQLLMRAGFPVGQIPAFSNARSFWFDVNRKLTLGAFVGGRDRILASVYQEYPGLQPGSPVLNPPPSGGPPPTPAPPPPPSPSERSGARAIIIGAAITAVGGIIATILANGFGTFDGNAPSKSASTSPTTLVSTNSSSDLLSTLVGKTLIGKVHEKGISDYNISVSVADDAGKKATSLSVGTSQYAGKLTNGQDFTCDNDLYLLKRTPLGFNVIEKRRGVSSCFTEDELRITSANGGLTFEVWATKPQPGVTLPTDQAFAAGSLRELG